MRKGDKTIKKLSKKDIAALKMLARTGHVKHEVLKDYTGISENRINTLKNMNYIEVVYDNRSNNEYLRFTCDGRDYVEKQLDILPYKSNAPKHDTAIVNYYMSMTKEEQESWVTETELHRGLVNMEESTENISPTDFCYIRNDEVVFVEIVTSNYSDDDIQAKEDYVSMIGGCYEQIDV